MEFTIANAVYSLAVGITHFIAEHKDKDAVNQEISNIATLIQNIIHPLLSRNITNLPLQQCLQGLQSVLSNTHEHMEMWKERRSRRMLALVNPWAVTQQLKDDRDQLMAHYTLLMGAMQVVDHIEGYNMITPPHKVVCPNCPPSQGKKKRIRTSEALDFWEKCIGKEVSKPKFSSSWLSTYLHKFLLSKSLVQWKVLTSVNNCRCGWGQHWMRSLVKGCSFVWTTITLGMLAWRLSRIWYRTATWLGQLTPILQVYK